MCDVINIMIFNFYLYFFFTYFIEVEHNFLLLITLEIVMKILTVGCHSLLNSSQIFVNLVLVRYCESIFSFKFFYHSFYLNDLTLYFYNFIFDYLIEIFSFNLIFSIQFLRYAEILSIKTLMNDQMMIFIFVNLLYF